MLARTILKAFALCCVMIGVVPATSLAASNLVVTLDPNAPKAVLKDAPAYDITATVTNFGDTAASNVKVYNWGAQPIANPQCVPSAYWGANTCEIASLPAGWSVSVTLRNTSLSTFGQRSIDTYVWKDSPIGEGPDARTSDRWTYFVTDGSVEVPRVDFASYPRTASRGETLHYFGTIANIGATPLTNGVLAFRASTFQASQAIQGMTISSGASCGKLSDTSASWWRCPVQGLAPGGKLMVDVTVVFTEPSTAVADLMLQYQPVGHPYFDWDAGAATTRWVSTQLNGGDAADLDVALSTPGESKLTVTNEAEVSVTNHGPQMAKAAEVVVHLRGSAGFVNLPANCSGDAKRVECAFGAMASGATATAKLPLLGTALGDATLVATTASATFDPLDENNRIVGLVKVTKAPPLPLKVVTPKAPPMALALALRTGIPTTLSCPRACNVLSELYVSARDAKRLGLGRAAAKPVRIGLARKATKRAGKVTMRTLVARKHRAKLAKTVRPVVITRKTTITTADGAKRIFSQHIRLKPGRR